MVDGGEPGVDSRDEGKHTGRNDFVVEASSASQHWRLFVRSNIN